MRCVRWSLFTILGILLVSSSNINWGADHWRTVLQVDARGYHAYLPALLLEHDPNFGSFEATERIHATDPDRIYDYRAQVDGKYINKYFLGTALLEAPLFLAAHGYALATGAQADGWSKPYVVAVNLSAIAWVLIGCWCLGRTLSTYGIADSTIAFTLFCFVFGTNLFYYIVVAPGMSHAYSFGLCCCILLVGRRYALEPRAERLPWLLGLLGLIILVRPVNGLVLLALPIVFDTPEQAKLGLRIACRSTSQLVVGAVVLLFILGLQLGYYRAATGSWFVYSYGEEGFNWTDPHLMDMLWSYRKGLFVYTPITLLALAGLWPLWQRSRGAALAWIGFFLLLTYVLSSWWNWWYGGSFGSRVYVEYLPLFALLFGLALHALRGVPKRIFISIALLLVVVCQIQTYQARYYRIHWSDMDKDRYWEEFVRIDKLP